jgi:hypothetical protein
MDDLQQFANPFGNILTPQALAALRAAQQQQALDQARQQRGVGYAARVGGMMLGDSLGRMAGPPNTPLDQSAAQNQQILTDNSNVPAPTGDPYTDRAALLEAKAAQFHAAGRPDIAMQLGAAAMQARQTGLAAQREQGQADVEAGKAAEQKAGAQYVVVDNSPDAQGIPQYRRYGDSISLYGPDGKPDPNFQATYQAAMQAAKQAGATSPMLMRVDQLENSKSQAAAIRAQAAALKASQQGQSVFAGDQSALDQMTGTFALAGMPALARLPAADRAAVMKNLTAHGLNFQDAAEARMQYTALQHAINTGATRAGQVAFLNNEIPGQAKNVLDALNGVDRTRIQLLNKAIAAGKTEFSDPGEKRYAVAIQGLITPYARLIAGATGQTTDAAREHAYGILTTGDGPDAVRAAIDQIVNHELVVAGQAGEGVIEMARNSTRYSALRKVAEKLGVPVASLDGGDGGLGSGGAPSLGGPGGAPVGASGAPGAAAGVPTATGPGGTKLYLINGQWTANPPGSPAGSRGGSSGSF